MKNILVKPDSWVRFFFPLIHKARYWAWKFYDRVGIRLVICGGKVRFMDVVLNFPENVGMLYSTPLFWNGPKAYEEPTSRTIISLAGQSRLFLDIGSNIGVYAVYVGVKFPQVKVIAFEPVPDIWTKNCKFHRANNLPEKNIKKIALSDRDGPQQLYLPVYDTGIEEEQTATLRPNSWQAHEKKVEMIEVQCLTFDSFRTANPLPDGLCCMKIDVENNEAAVLRGAKKFIIERRPWIVCEILPREEFNVATKTKHNNNRETLELVQELGYTPYAITGEGFFRMNAAGFAQPRNLKDFLLIPREKIPEDIFFFASETLNHLLNKGG